MVVITIVTLLLASILIIYSYIKWLTFKYLRINIFLEKAQNNLRSEEELINYFKDKSELNILILTGGGLRGIVPLSILSYIEQKLGKKTGEIFDFFSGASTGAISAAALAVKDNANYYKYSAADILENYLVNANNIFSAPWYHKVLTLAGLLAPKFTLEGKTKVLDSYFKNLRISDLKSNLLIPIYDINNNELEIVKNWKADDETESYDYLVKDLINGASSPPMFFPPTAILLDKCKTKLFVDPAILLNNPILSALLPIRALFPSKKINVVLIGNSGLKSSQFLYNNITDFGAYGLFQYLVNSPSLNSKLSLRMMQEYMDSSQCLDSHLTFTKIYSKNQKSFNQISISKKNFENIKKYNLDIIEENKEDIDNLINNILNHSIS